MSGNEFLAAYPAKLLEYTLATGYLMLFVFFWRYLQGGRRAPAAERMVHRAPAMQPAAGATAQGWFTLPAGVLLHPGHTWARATEGGLVEVGLDDFAARLLGPVERLTLPQPGTSLAQGAQAIVAEEAGKQVGLVSPVDGTVSEVNPAAFRDGAWQQEPYGAGWLMRVKPARLAANARQLLGGEAGQRWMAQAADALLARATPQLGAVLQDGGALIPGIARELEPDRWDELCREHFRS